MKLRASEDGTDASFAEGSRTQEATASEHVSADAAPLRVAHSPDAKLPAHSSPELLRFHLEGAALPAGELAPLGVPGLTGCGPGAVMDLEQVVALYVEQLRHTRAAAVVRLSTQLRGLSARLSDLLDADGARAPQASQVGGAASAYGERTSDGLDMVGLLARLPRTARGPVKLSDTARQRLRACLATLEEGVRMFAEPDVGVFASEQVDPTGGGWPPGPESLTAATRELLAAIERHLAIARAARAARLELDHAYHPELHDAVLAALSPDMLSDDERLALPVRVVALSPEVLGAQLLALLSTPLSLHVLSVAPSVHEEGVSFPAGAVVAALAQALGGFVVQTSTLAPAHMQAGLARMASTVGPALGLLATVTDEADATCGALAVQSRAYPLWLFDAAASIEERLSLVDNPAWQEAWASCELACVDAAGLSHVLTLRRTPADLAVAAPALRGHLRPLGAEEWAADQLPADAFLAAWEAGELRGELPFVWVEGRGGSLERALVTRSWMARAREVARDYRELRAQAGVDNAWAAVGARDASAALQQGFAAERAALEQSREKALGEARRQGASEAVQRIVGVLLAEVDGPLPDARVASHETALADLAPQSPSPTAGPAPAARAPVAEPLPASEVGAAQADSTPQEPSFGEEEAFVDSARCTTCNECTQRFAAVFEYDDNKQARLKDPATAPFAALVAAAEKCPARCIYPGAPRPDDPSVTDELVERARALG